MNVGSGSVRGVTALLVASLVAMWLTSCVPEEPASPDPTNIVTMSDEQVEAKLIEATPELQAAIADPAILESIPPEHREEAQRIVRDLSTPEGRDRLVAEFRADAASVRGGFERAKEKFAGGVLDSVVGLSIGDETTPTLHGVRDAAPPTNGTSVPFESTSGNCSAPGGQGDLPVPTGLVPNQLITPQHDVFATYSFRFDTVTFFDTLTPSGVPTINGDAGVEFRGGRGSWQMHVQVDMQDVNKGFPLRALAPVFHLRTLGGTAAQEVQVSPVEGSIRCYAGDAPESRRGYFDGWIPIGPGEPGFQLITEVVENDYYFRFGGPAFDALLSAAGPQFFAGADRSTVHIGKEPISSSRTIPHSVGAFATASQDPGNGAPNALTDTNDAPADDVESAVSGLLESKVVGALSDQLEGTLSNYYAITVWGSAAERPEADVDIRFVDPTVSFPDVTDEPAGHVGAIEAAISGEGHADVAMQVLGTPCYGLTLDVSFDSVADIWADSAGSGTGIIPRFKVSTEPDTNLDMPWYDWPLVPCVTGFLLVAGSAPGNVEDGVNGALDDALGDGGDITKLMKGLDLDDFIPHLTIGPVSIGGTTTGSAVLRPHVSDLDNAWCGATGAPAGCSPDQSLIGANGVEVVADASLLSNEITLINTALNGRFPNVYAPTVTSTVDNLVTSHRDAANVTAGLGIVVDPGLVNLALRALAQGPALGRTTNGLVDIPNFKLPISGYRLSTRPEVAPMVMGAYGPTGGTDGPTVRAAAPDMRLDLRTSEQDPSGIRFSAAATVNVGLAFDPVARSVRPVLDSPIIDLQVTGGCQANYDNGYASSYLICGRGAGGNGGTGITSLTDLLDQIANAVVLPLIDGSIGNIGLPSLDGLLPGAHLALANLRFSQRGGNLAIYIDIAPMPLLRLVGSTAGYGGDDDTIRFFAVPTNIDLVNTPTTYTWKITDAIGGGTVPFTYLPGTGKSGVQFPSSAFVVSTDLDKHKTVNGSLTLDQTGLHIVGNGTFSWVRPSPVPPPNCPPAPGSFLQIAPGGAGGYGSIKPVIC